MKKASQIRRTAREALTGKWGTAIGVAVTASVLSGGLSSLLDAVTQGTTEMGLSSISSVSTMAMLTAMSAVLSVLGLILGGAVQMGAAKYYLNAIGGKQAVYSDVFSQMNRIGAGLSMTLLRSLFTVLWMIPVIVVMMGVMFIVGLQLILTTNAVPTPEAILEGYLVWSPLMIPAMIPAMIAQYRYALMPYLMSEYTGLSAMNAMRESKRLMKGNKWRLFCLEMSFFGWYLLSFVSLGIGFLWLAPYMNAAYAAFYRDVMDSWKAQVQTPLLPEPEL